MISLHIHLHGMVLEQKDNSTDDVQKKLKLQILIKYDRIFRYIRTYRESVEVKFFSRNNIL